MREQKRQSRLVWAGLIGSVIVGLCCFIPMLVALLGLLGLAALTGYVDCVLLTALAVFVGVRVYGLYRERRPRQWSYCDEQTSHP
ncbi:MAG: mercury resistance system transport protein MerF [Nitrospirales bacterium]|nr:mercury resistance system transport protein MerF [Nitrospirales bacterium]